MEDKQGWGGTQLEHHLRLDYWEPRLACGALCFHLFTQENCTVQEAMGRMNKDQKAINRLLQLWSSESDSVRLEKHPPAFFIEWALSKNIKPEWLDWAIERGLYISKKKTAEDNITSADSPVPLAFDKESTA